MVTLVVDDLSNQLYIYLHLLKMSSGFCLILNFSYMENLDSTLTIRGGAKVYRSNISFNRLTEVYFNTEKYWLLFHFLVSF